MSSQNVFKGTLGWDDWVWWSVLGGAALFLLMVLLCCVVCVQRAKRKGREEAMAAVQARERERHQAEQAQLRYAQAQQARYPSREPSFRYSKPEPPVMRSTAPQYGQPPQNDYYRQQQQQQQQAPLQQAAGRPGAAYGATPWQQYDPDQRQHQAQQFGGGGATHAAVGGAQAQAPRGAPGHHYQRPVNVHPEQPPLLQYRKTTSAERSRSDSMTDTFEYDNGQPGVAFVAMPSPRRVEPDVPVGIPLDATLGRNVTITELRQQQDWERKPTPALAQPERRFSGSSMKTSSSRGGNTLRDRIEALREGTTLDNHTRISGCSASFPAWDRHGQPPADTSRDDNQAEELATAREPAPRKASNPSTSSDTSANVDDVMSPLKPSAVDVVVERLRTNTTDSVDSRASVEF
ncbi:hypothetical protein P43SY_006645 [Pythium insidiosum]|uniref:Uncharacterized protein n=1 Tax=Pythium insidiosum TaxID=114742 RepID=A0AAD5M0B5_PYTIN|nr:hypothetical protein P43SY_006645 [Pythium insidiosum]